MARLTRGIPVVPAEDVESSIAFYRKLGFTDIYRDAEPPHYAVLERDGTKFHLAAVGEGLAKTVAAQTMCRFGVDDVDGLFAEVSRLEGVVHPNGRLQDKPWGNREFTVLDPAGVCVTFFGEELPSRPKPRRRKSRRGAKRKSSARKR